ncbi:MAG TPA: hypothetical protein VMS98_05755 [Thermoanaerobaculia bacterium]|nr:hypothetical protein [Thermoanaerobaculia bacterium]
MLAGALGSTLLAITAATVQPCPAGRPLGGNAEMQLETSHDITVSRSGRARIWFDLAPMLSFAWRVDLAAPWTATEMTWRTEADECVDLPDPEGRNCRCPGARGSGVADLAHGGSVTFHPTDPYLYITFPQELFDSTVVDHHCTHRSGDSKGGIGLKFLDPIEIMPRGRSAWAIFVDGTECAGESPPSDCYQHADRYAVIPFAGSGLLTWDRGHGNESNQRVQWEVCCGCGEPPRQGMEGEDDPCGNDDQERGLLEVAVAMAQAHRNELRPRFERYQENIRLAEMYRSDFELVSNSCAGWDIALTLMQALLGGPSAPKAAQALGQLTGIIQKVLAGDPSVILSGADSVSIDLLGVKGFTVGNLWDAAAGIYGAALAVQNAGSLEAMKERLEECAAVPLVSDLVYNDARKHLRHLEAAYQELPAIHQLTLRLEQADIEVFNRWHAWHRSCVQEAECRGTDPDECKPPPQ